MNSPAPPTDHPPADQSSADHSRHPVGGICWIDLGVRDCPAAVRFYSRLFGWEFAPPDPTGYRLASLDGHLVAALGPAEDPGPPYWTVYVHTTDAAATAQAAVRTGGTLIVPPTPAGDAGIAATIRTPSGAPLSLWQPRTHTGTWTSTRRGTLAYATLRTATPHDDQAFLRAVLGWQLEPDGVIICQNRHVGRWTTPAPDPRPAATPAWLVAFHLDDNDAATQRAIDLGARAHDTRSGALTDPTGATFAITTPRRPTHGQTRPTR
jgi:uncharacterized protein